MVGVPKKSHAVARPGPIRSKPSAPREASSAKTKAPTAVAELKGSTRHWLRMNGHSDIADTIDEAMAAWRRAGVTTRRNWWDILAGDDRGRPRKVAGRAFPVLAAAQRRQGKTVTKNAI